MVHSGQAGMTTGAKLAGLQLTPEGAAKALPGKGKVLEAREAVVGCGTVMHGMKTQGAGTRPVGLWSRGGISGMSNTAILPEAHGILTVSLLDRSGTSLTSR